MPDQESGQAHGNYRSGGCHERNDENLVVLPCGDPLSGTLSFPSSLGDRGKLDLEGAKWNGVAGPGAESGEELVVRKPHALLNRTNRENLVCEDPRHPKVGEASYEDGDPLVGRYVELHATYGEPSSGRSATDKCQTEGKLPSPRTISQVTNIEGERGLGPRLEARAEQGLVGRPGMKAEREPLVFSRLGDVSHGLSSSPEFQRRIAGMGYHPMPQQFRSDNMVKYGGQG